MLRTFRATKLQWKMHHTWLDPMDPMEHRGGDLGTWGSEMRTEQGKIYGKNMEK